MSNETKEIMSDKTNPQIDRGYACNVWAKVRPVTIFTIFQNRVRLVHDCWVLVLIILFTITVSTLLLASDGNSKSHGKCCEQNQLIITFDSTSNEDSPVGNNNDYEFEDVRFLIIVYAKSLSYYAASEELDNLLRKSLADRSKILTAVNLCELKFTNMYGPVPILRNNYLEGEIDLNEIVSIFKKYGIQLHLLKLKTKEQDKNLQIPSNFLFVDKNGRTKNMGEPTNSKKQRMNKNARDVPTITIDLVSDVSFVGAENID